MDNVLRTSTVSLARECVLREANSIISHLNSGKIVIDMFVGREGNIVHAHGVLMGGLISG